MSYIDGYLIPVPHDKRADYQEMAEFAAPLFIEHGAIEVVEGWGDDLARGHTTDYFMAVKAEEGENIVFSWIVWPDKAARDAGNAAVMADKRFEAMGDKNVFDGKRMIYSGFQTLVSLKA